MAPHFCRQRLPKPEFMCAASKLHGAAAVQPLVLLHVGRVGAVGPSMRGVYVGSGALGRKHSHSLLADVACCCAHILYTACMRGDTSFCRLQFMAMVFSLSRASGCDRCARAGVSCQRTCPHCACCTPSEIGSIFCFTETLCCHIDNSVALVALTGK